MPLQLYTKPSDEALIESVKIKALKEKVSVSTVVLKLLNMWLEGKIKLDSKGEIK